MRKILMLAIVLLSQGLELWAQANESVDKKIDSIQNDFQIVDYINHWSNKNYIKNPSQAFHYLQVAHQLSTKLEYHKGAGLALMRMGVIEKRKENYFNANKFYDEAIQNFSIINDSLNLQKTLFNRSTIYLQQSLHNLALNDLYSCLKFFERIDEKKLISKTHNNIGLVFKHVKEYDKAFEHYKEAEHIIKENNLKSSFYSANTNIGNVLSLQKKHNQALSYYKKNLAVLKEKPNKYSLAQTYHNIGTCFLGMGKYPFALEYLKQSLQLKEEIGNKNLVISTINSIAHIFYLQSNFEQALKYRKKALVLAIETKNIVYQKNCYKEI